MRPKRQNTQKKAYTALLDASLAKDIDQLCKQLGQSRSQTMINLIEIGLDCAEKLAASGLAFLITAGRGEASAIRWAYLSGQLDLDAVLNKGKKEKIPRK